MAAAAVDPYNNQYVIPLADFIEHPIAHELVHNGQTLQVSLALPVLHAMLPSLQVVKQANLQRVLSHAALC